MLVRCNCVLLRRHVTQLAAAATNTQVDWAPPRLCQFITDACSIRLHYNVAMPTAIRCANLTKRYEGKQPVDAVRGLDLAVETGECFGLLGPNGAGKTTTIEIIEGLLGPTSGEVEVLGMQWRSHEQAIRERIGISLQETKLSENLSVRETLTLFRSFYVNGLEPDEAMHLVSLEEKATAWVGKLSGGQKQRLAVACALVGDPDLLFLDEPTTGLDPQARRQLWDIIRDFRSHGRTVLLTTHYMDEAERLCDRVAIIDHGKVIALGSPRELIASLGGEQIIEFSVNHGGQAIEAPPLTVLPGVQSARVEDGQFSLAVTELHVTLPALLEKLKQQSCNLASLTTRHASLEDVFVKLTGRHLRDGEANA
jgi:ABC-2 type transport system ATP-binding protein